MYRSLAILALVPTLLLAQDIVVRPAAPATAPTTKPADKKPLATITPQAESTLKQIAAAYANLKSLELAGTITFKTESPGEKRSHETTFTASYLAPNRFRHQAKDQPVLGGTGDTVYGSSKRGNIFARKQVEGKVLISELPEDLAVMLVVQNPSLALAISKDPIRDLRSISSQITREPDQNVDGKPCMVIKVTLGEEKVPTLLFFDAATKLLRQVSIDYRPALAKSARADMTTAAYTLDYTKIQSNADLKAEAFAWTAPFGGRDVTAAGAQPGGGAEPEDAVAALVGQPAPDFTLEDLDGNTVKLSELKGSVVILDFWATWCGPCVASMPSLNKLYESTRAAGVKVYAVNQKEDKDKIQEFLDKHNLTLPVLLDKEAKVAESYGVRGIPTTVIVGKDGKVQWTQVGYGPGGEEKLKEGLKAAMSGR